MEVTRREAIEKALLGCHVHDDDVQWMADIIEQSLEGKEAQPAVEEGLRRCKIWDHLITRMAEKIVQAISKVENDGGRHEEEE